GYGAFRNYFEMPDLGSIVYVGSSAQLNGFAKSDGSHLVAVFLAEEGNSAMVNSLLEWDLPFFVQWNVFRDPLIHKILHLLYLFCSQFAEVGEVKAQVVALHHGAFLLHMRSQHFPQGLVQQVGGRVVGSCF